MTIVGTRPELIKLCRVIAELEKHVDHILVHTGQNFDYELNDIFFQQLRISKPHYYLNAAGANANETIANIIKETDKVLNKENPDAVLVFGDTNSCLSVLAAKRRKIPIFHMEAGNRCFDLRVPEEINRRIVDHIADINMVISEHARRYLIHEGIKQDTIINVGSTMMEVLDYYKDEIAKSDIINKESLNPKEYFIVSIHREENVDSKSNFINLVNTLDSITKMYTKKVIVSTHPRTRLKLEKMGLINDNPLIIFMKPFGFFEYIKLQQNALCVISDSGTLTEEASILKFPSVTIRQAHERLEGMDEGTLIMTGMEEENILHSIKVVIDHFMQTPEPYKTIKDYQVQNVSRKVIKIILSYTDFINRTVWYKNSI